MTMSAGLHIASQNGHISQSWTKAGDKQLLLMTTVVGISCLHSASLLGHLAVVDHLMKVGSKAFPVKSTAYD